jgi:hypothetical protein
MENRPVALQCHYEGQIRCRIDAEQSAKHSVDLSTPPARYHRQAESRRFVASKAPEQQSPILHRKRQLLIRQQTRFQALVPR